MFLVGQKKPLGYRYFWFGITDLVVLSQRQLDFIDFFLLDILLPWWTIFKMTLCFPWVPFITQKVQVPINNIQRNSTLDLSAGFKLYVCFIYPSLLTARFPVAVNQIVFVCSVVKLTAHLAVSNQQDVTCSDNGLFKYVGRLSQCLSLVRWHT